MANQDLMPGQNHNHPALDQHPMLASHDQNLELNHENQEDHHHLQDVRKNHNSELDSGHSLDLEESVNQAQQNESLMEPKLNREDNHELDNSEVYLLDGNVTEQQELDDVNTDNLDLSVEHNEEGMGMEMVVHHDPNQVEYVNEQSPVVQARAIMASPHYELAVGQEFTDVKSCRRALRDTAIALHFEIQTIKSDKNRFTAKCASEGCPWRIHAAKLPGVPNFTIRTINGNHTCGGISHLGHHQASVQWVAESVEQRLLENPNCKPKEILEEIHRTHGITLSYKQAWRGKERVMAAMRGSFEEGYRLLPQYCAQIKRTNPGSIASVYSNPTDGSFQRLFISFHASIYGFLNACRPLLGLDRTILKSKYLGTLLVAAGVDGDGAVFPLAFGVVDEENDDNWMWFLSELHNLLEMNSENMPMLTILSDRRKGIVDGVGTNFPTAFHGFCLRHLCESFRKEFNNTILVNLLWEAGHALTRVECLAKIAEMKEMSGDAANWVERVPLHLWATSFFEGTRFGHLTANIVESLNAWISEASSLPIVQMMECIRRQLMTWFNERREASLNWTSILVPSAERHIADSIEAAQNFQVFKPGEQFEVVSSDGTRQTVDVRNRCCLCRGWQLYGLPCAHAVAALLSCRQNVHRFTDSCFTVAAYRKAYSQTIHPIPDKSLWKEMMLEGGGDEGGVVAVEEVVVNPPQSFRAPGRPRKRRVRAEDQGKMKRVVHCSRCNQTGHFRTTCAAPI